MPSLQYVIDTICASVTVECVYKIIEAFLSRRSFTIDEIIPLIQCKDRSLDLGSAKKIAETALNDIEQRGVIRIEGENIFPTNYP